MDIEYAYQALDDIPEGVSIPEGRKKPWGTSHAVLAARSDPRTVCRDKCR